jgi:hypothetical protein
MSTTVIASSAGLSLYLAPWASGKVDMAAVNRVLQSHGLQTRDQAQPNMEFIAAEGLEPEAAQALGEDLKAIGLRVRIRQRVGLERSARVGQAMALQLIAMGMLIGLILPVAINGGTAPNLAALIPLLMAALYAIANTVSIGIKGGNVLERVAEPARQQGQVSNALLEMRDELPDGLFTRLLTQAQDLEAKVAKNPNGQAAQELEELAASLRERNDAETVDQVSELKQELEAARRAIAEAKRSGQQSAKRSSKEH